MSIEMCLSAGGDWFRRSSSEKSNQVVKLWLADPPGVTQSKDVHSWTYWTSSHGNQTIQEIAKGLFTLIFSQAHFLLKLFQILCPNMLFPAVGDRCSNHATSSIECSLESLVHDHKLQLWRIVFSLWCQYLVNCQIRALTSHDLVCKNSWLLKKSDARRRLNKTREKLFLMICSWIYSLESFKFVSEVNISKFIIAQSLKKTTQLLIQSVPRVLLLSCNLPERGVVLSKLSLGTCNHT